MKRVFTKLVCAALASVMTISCAPVADFAFVPQLAVETAAAAITAQAAGWNETAYVEWLPVSGATAYDVYVKSTGGSYTQLDSELVRNYSTFWRADALGLAKGTYNMKVVAKNSSGTEVGSWESGSITVNSYIRDGFAFSDGGSSSGAYNDDGTLKSGAKVFYVTDDNKDTITCNVVTDSKGTATACTGMGAIIKALEKGYETTPMVFRFIGQVHAPASEQSLNQLDIKKAQNPITIEGVGNDAFALFGFNLVTANNIEIRNIGFKDMTTKDEDGVTIKSQSKRIWVHNCDFFYGGQGSDKDQAKGDGTVDLKNTSTKITVSENHYWDSGKVNLCGLGESADYEISYSRNWFDHSDSRHPRVRTGSIHVYNNYYDGVAKYGVGACTGSSIFVEGNYFRNTKYPVMSSMQGTDATGDGTFSSEAGGIIKMYDNIMVGTYTFVEANSSSGLVQSSDGYTVANRSDTVPSTLTTVKGGTSYNNFDTTRDLGVAASGVLAAKDVPAYVTANAGRINGGNFKFIFDDSVDDADYSVNTTLTSALAAYDYKANTSYVSSASATGVDGSTFYTTRDSAYTAKVSTLATETDTSGNKATGGGSSSETTTKSSEGTTETTTKNTEVSTETTTKNTEGSTETTTVNPSGAASMGKYVLGKNASGGDFNVTANGTHGNITFNFWTYESNGVKLRSGNQSTFTLSDETLVTINYVSGAGTVITDGTTIYAFDDTESMNTLPAGSYTLMGASDGNSTISSITLKATGSTTTTTTTTTTEGTTETTTATKETETQTTTSATADVPAGGESHNFTTNGKTSTFYTITGNLATNKGTVSYNNLTLTQCLKMETDTSITFTAASAGKLTLVFAESGKKVKVDGTEYTTDSSGIATVDIAAGSHTITKGDPINLFYMNFASEGTTTEGTTETTTTTKETETQTTTQSSSDTGTVQVNPSATGYSFTTATAGKLTTATYGGASANYNNSTNYVEIGSNGAYLYDSSATDTASGTTGVATTLTMPLTQTYTSGKLTVSGTVKPSTNSIKWAYIDIQGANGSVVKIGTNDDTTNKYLAISTSTQTVNGTTSNVYESSTVTAVANETYTYTAVLDLDNKTVTVTIGGATLTSSLVNTSVSSIVATTSMSGARNLTVGDITIAYESSTTPSVTKGDANGDGYVTGDDVKHILQYVTGKIEAVVDAVAADVTGDSKVTTRDANKIKKYVLGKISSL